MTKLTINSDGGSPVTVRLGEDTEVAQAAAAEAKADADRAQTIADGLTIENIIQGSEDLPIASTLNGNEIVAVQQGAFARKLTLFELAQYINGDPATPPPLNPVILGSRLAVMGDSRQDRGVVPQENNGDGFSNGVPMETEVEGIHTWLCAATGNKLEVTGQWTRSGGRSSEFCHTFALDTIAATNPDCVIYLGNTNGHATTGGYEAIPLGDPDADPSTLARVGATDPLGTGNQGTEYGNLDKLITYFGSLSPAVPVIAFELPAEGGGTRTTHNASVNNWLRAQYEARTYSNLIFVEAYEQLGPSSDRTAPYTGTWRTDIEPSVGPLSAEPSGSDKLHLTPAAARLVGEFIGSQISSSVADLSSLFLLPDGTNDASFITANPTLSQGSGGTVGGAGTAPTGTAPQEWRVENEIPGTSSVAISYLAQGIRLTITRSGVVSGSVTSQIVEVLGDPVNITPVAGDTYRVHLRCTVPARSAQDIYAVNARVNFFEVGMESPTGTDVRLGAYQSFAKSNPQPFPKDGDTIDSVSVPFEVTADMVATADGAIGIRPIIEIALRDDTDTTVNGNIEIDIIGCGISKVAGTGTPTPTPPSGGSLVTTADFTPTGTGDSTHRNIIDADSFQMARNGSGNPTYQVAIANGTYTVSGTLSAYSGSATGITALGARISDNFSNDVVVNTAGAFSVSVTITSGTMRFWPTGSGAGFDWDNLSVVAA